MRIVVLTRRGEPAPALAAAVSRRHALELVEPERVLARLGGGGCDLVIVDLGGAEGADGLGGAGGTDGADGADAEDAWCAKIRAAHRALPVLALTREGDVAARVRALEQGADDALSRPGAPSQIAARVDALGRRAALAPPDPERIEADGATIDLGRALCARDGRTVRLTAREVEIVRWLVRHAGRPVARAELLEHVWGVAPTIETRAVDVAVAELRKKVERDPARPALVVSVRGLGYAWRPDLT